MLRVSEGDDTRKDRHRLEMAHLQYAYFKCVGDIQTNFTHTKYALLLVTLMLLSQQFARCTTPCLQQSMPVSTQATHHTSLFTLCSWLCRMITHIIVILTVVLFLPLCHG